MAGKTAPKSKSETAVTIEEVNRVLEVGRLLLSVLTPEELEQLQQLLNDQPIKRLFNTPTASTSDAEIGNTGVT